MLTSTYRLHTCTCGKLVTDVKAHQNLHRDPVKITTPWGPRLARRTGSMKFHCKYPGCEYRSKHSGNFQVSVCHRQDELGVDHTPQRHSSRCSHAQKDIYTEKCGYPTPEPTNTHTPDPSDDDIPMTDEDPGEHTADDELDVEMAEFQGEQDDAPADSDAHMDDDRLWEYPDSEPEHDDKDDADYIDTDEGEGSLSGLPEVGWSKDTVQTDEMARLGICVNTAVRVIVCLGCRVVVKPSDLDTHIARDHPVITSNPTFYQELVDAYNLQPEPLGTRPGSIVTAIYGLDILDGYSTCDNCGYACKGEKRVKEHLKTAEGCKSQSKRYVQTFQPTSKRMYFGVTLKPMADEDEDAVDPIAYLRGKYAPAPFCDRPIESPSRTSDTHQFLAAEHWDRYVEGKTGAEIHHAVREQEPELRQEVRNCVERFNEEVVKKLNASGTVSMSAMGDYLG